MIFGIASVKKNSLKIILSQLIIHRILPLSNKRVTGACERIHKRDIIAEFLCLNRVKNAVTSYDSQLSSLPGSQSSSFKTNKHGTY